MNVKGKLEDHYRETFNNILTDSGLLQNNASPKLINAILKLYKPWHQEKIAKLLNGMIQEGNLQEKIASQKTIDLAASCVTEKIIKIATAKTAPEEMAEIIDEGFHKAKSQLYTEGLGNNSNISISEIGDTDKAINWIISKDIPDAILGEINEIAHNTILRSPDKITKFSEPCSVKYVSGLQVKSCELNSVDDALEFIWEHPGKNEVIVNKSSQSKNNREKEIDNFR